MVASGSRPATPAPAETVLVVEVVSGRVVLWNEAEANLLGYPLADAVQLPFDGLVAPEDRRLARDLLGGIADPGSNGRRRALSDVTFLDRDGGRHRVEVSASLVHPDDHPGRYGALIGRDIVERVTLGVALRASWPPGRTARRRRAAIREDFAEAFRASVPRVSFTTPDPRPGWARR